jgi:DNA (cytosine-5)-methyltransferase 1
MRVGLEAQGWSVRYANDLDERKYEMYREQFPDASRHFLLGDIREVTPESVPAITLATASFPCNDLSLAGARGGLEGAQSSAFWGFVSILTGMAERRPPLVLIENVPGFLTSGGGKDLQAALAALNGLDYAVDIFVVDAAHFVPQSRPRLFIIGVLGAAAEEPELPGESPTRPRMLMDFIARHPEIRWDIRRLPQPPERTLTLRGILEDLPKESPCWWNRERTGYLLDQMSERHRLLADRMQSGAKWSYGTVFRRIRNGKSMAELRTDGIAGCLRTPRGGSGRQILIKAGKGEILARLLTPRECARLMGADDFRIAAPSNQALFGFGDAVCAPVIEWIAKHYLNPVVNELLRGRPLAAAYN